MNDIFWDYVNHPESKFDGNVGVLSRKHLKITGVTYIGKESNNLDESEVLGVDPDSYEIYENVEDLDCKFRKIVKDVLKMNPRDVKKFGISKQTLWNVKKKIISRQICRISNNIKIKLIEIIRF